MGAARTSDCAHECRRQVGEGGDAEIYGWKEVNRGNEWVYENQGSHCTLVCEVNLTLALDFRAHLQKVIGLSFANAAYGAPTGTAAVSAHIARAIKKSDFLARHSDCSSSLGKQAVR